MPDSGISALSPVPTAKSPSSPTVISLSATVTLAPASVRLETPAPRSLPRKPVTEISPCCPTKPKALGAAMVRLDPAGVTAM